MLPFAGFCLAMLEIAQLSLKSEISLGFIVSQFYASADGTVFCVIIRIRSPSAAIHFSLQKVLFLFDVLHPVCQLHKVCLLFGGICQRLRADIKTYRPLPDGMYRVAAGRIALYRRLSLQRKLRIPAIPRLAGLSQDPDIFYPIGQHLGFIRIIGRQFQRKIQTLPFNIASSENDLNASAFSGDGVSSQ